MARATGIEVRMRLAVETPLTGLLYSLQKDDAPYDAKASTTGEPLVFEFPVRVAEGKFLGDFVWREGKERRFVYLRVEQMAGDPASKISGRVKADIHEVPMDLIGAALAGGVIEARFVGSRDGKPVLATVKPAWQPGGRSENCLRSGS